MTSLRSLRYKIAFIFFLVTALAFMVIWFVVVPQLESNLKERRLDNLLDEARAARPALELPLVGGRQPSAKEFAERIATAEDATDARVTVRYWQRQRSKDRNPGFYPVDNSHEVVPFDEALARDAIESRHILRAYGMFHDDEIGMIA